MNLEDCDLGCKVYTNLKLSTSIDLRMLVLTSQKLACDMQCGFISEELLFKMPNR